MNVTLQGFFLHKVCDSVGLGQVINHLTSGRLEFTGTINLTEHMVTSHIHKYIRESTILLYIQDVSSANPRWEVSIHSFCLNLDCFSLCRKVQKY